MGRVRKRGGVLPDPVLPEGPGIEESTGKTRCDEARES
jgi:hypothetical protein